MFGDLRDYQTVLKPYRYNSLEDLLDSLEKKVIGPAVAAKKKIIKRRASIEKTVTSRPRRKKMKHAN